MWFGFLAGIQEQRKRKRILLKKGTMGIAQMLETNLELKPQ